MLLDTWKIRRVGWFGLLNYTACRPYPYQLDPQASSSEVNKPHILDMTQVEQYEELYFHNGSPELVVAYEPGVKKTKEPQHPCIGVPKSIASIFSLLQLRARVQMDINERRELAEKNQPPPPPADDDDEDDNDDDNWPGNGDNDHHDYHDHQDDQAPPDEPGPSRPSKLSIPLRSSRQSGAGPSRPPWRP